MGLNTPLQLKVKYLLTDIPKENIHLFRVSELSDEAKGDQAINGLAMIGEGCVFFHFWPAPKGQPLPALDEALASQANERVQVTLGLHAGYPAVAIWQTIGFKHPYRDQLSLQKARESLRQEKEQDDEDETVKPLFFDERLGYFSANYKDGRVIPFEITDEGAGGEQQVRGAMIIKGTWDVLIHLEGYCDCNTQSGYGFTIVFELYNDKLRLLVWNDIFDEDPEVKELLDLAPVEEINACQAER